MMCTVCGQPDSRNCLCSSPQPLALVGSELRDIIPKFLKTKSCKCEDVAAWMDRIGIEGCEKNREKIIDHLVSQAKKMTMGATPGAAAKLVAEKWLDKAIANAKAKISGS